MIIVYKMLKNYIFSNKNTNKQYYFLNNATEMKMRYPANIAIRRF